MTIHDEDENIIEDIFGGSLKQKDITNQKETIINKAFNNNNIKQIALNTNVKSIKQGGKKSYHKKGNIVLKEGYLNRTVIHELGHAVDYNNKWLSSNKKFIEAINKDRKIVLNNKSLYKKLINDNKNCRELSDILGAMTNNEVVGRYKHKAKYWSKPNKIQRETFAQMFTMAGKDDIKQLELFQKYLPNTFVEFDNLIRRLL